jgi:Ion channel
MLALHIAEFAIWAYALLYMGLIAHAYDALYFCANAYTTLGYGNVDLGVLWRNLSPIVGISGLFTMAWTTSALVGVVSSHRQLLEQMEDERELEIRMRLALIKKEWDALKEERGDEKSEREKTRMQANGASFFQKCRIWQQERKREEVLRRAVRAEIEDLHRKERQDEGKLGPETPPSGPGQNGQNSAR